MNTSQAHLHSNGLPARWAHSPHFVILETDFGLGHNFLATWDAWRRDAARCERLHVVSMAQQPPLRADLAREHAESDLPALAAALLHAWPPLTPNLHCLDFEGGHVQLTLCVAREGGDPSPRLRALRLQADAFYLSTARTAQAAHAAQHWTPQLLKAVGRLAAAGATASAQSVAEDLRADMRADMRADLRTGLRAGLITAGFELQQGTCSEGSPGMIVARHAPRHAPRRLPTLSVRTRSAVVVGAGLAGAAVAQAMARLGLTVKVLDREAAPAQGASGNPAGLFHGTVNAADGHYARLYRAAALAAASEYRHAIATGGATRAGDGIAGVMGQVNGLLRLAEHGDSAAGHRALLQRLGLPADYVEVLDVTAASQRAGVPLRQPCWHYPGGGWLAPARWVQHALRTPGVSFRGRAEVAALEHDGDVWWLRDAAGAVLERTRLVVLANAADASRLLAPLGHAPWPLRQTRGQVTHWGGRAPSPLALPVAGDGYALPMPGGLLCGATRQDDDADLRSRHADDLHNLSRLQQLTGLQAPADAGPLQSRAGLRVHSDDNLPIAGAVPALSMVPGQRLDQVRLLPRQAGLFVLTALGARGLTLAPLLGRLVAAQAVGTPWPLEQDLADAVDPARWIVRAARARTRPGAQA